MGLKSISSNKTTYSQHFSVPKKVEAEAVDVQGRQVKEAMFINRVKDLQAQRTVHEQISIYSRIFLLFFY